MRLLERSESSATATLLAALSVLLTSIAFTGVVADAGWVPSAAMTVGLVAGCGLLGRHFRWWPLVTVLAQLVVVLAVLSITYTDDAFLGVLPTPAALVELTDVLADGMGVLREGTPPVPADTGLRCLLSLGLGLVAVLVDTIAVAAGAPAVAGLALLCVFAIPASLAEDILPWAAFVAGAAAFALLLCSGGQHQRWNRRESRSSAARPALSTHGAAVAATATVLALITGTALTGVGTEGRLPGSDTGDSASGTGGIGLRPFTSLRGQLNRDQATELFRVRGLPHDTYLRAMTLRKFEPERGWELAGLAPGVGTREALPLPPGTHRVEGERARVEIEPVSYRDPWLPVFGVPTEVSGMGEGWSYDPAAGIVFTQTPQESKPYTEELILPDPSPEQLRNAQGPVEVAPAYLDISGVPPNIIELAEDLTANDRTKFDQAVSLNRYFTDPANGFAYDLNTSPPAGGGALEDFLFRGKRGYCEQYASSMAVLLRAVGIPSRVAVGFTSGQPEGDERVITTNDAHAWVEAYFPGYGWTTFDPTPLDDGRRSQAAPGVEPQPVQEPPPGEQAAPPPGQPADAPAGDRDREGGDGSALGLLAPVIGVLTVLLALSALPWGVRELRRRKRLQAVSADAPGSAESAWREVLDESRDRGVRASPSATARKVADALVDQHGLDEAGTAALRTLVGAVEKEWYGPPGQAAAPELPTALHAVLASLRRQDPLGWRARLLPHSVLDRVRPQA